MSQTFRAITLAVVTSVMGWNITAHGETTMASLQTVCIGRFLVDLPADARASTSASYQWIKPHKPAQAGIFSKLQQQLTSQADQYRMTHMIRDPDSDRFWRKAGDDPDKKFGLTQLVGFDIDPVSQQVVLAYHPDAGKPGIVTVIHKVVGRWDYAFETEDYGANDYPKARQALQTAAAQFQPLAVGDLPRGPGFCVEGGIFVDTGKPPVRESFTLAVRFVDHPDVRLVIDARAIDKADKDEPSLKHRVDSELAVLRAGIDGHVGVLARDELSAADQVGYQIAISAPYDIVPNTRVLKFFWSADGVPNDVARPFMEIDMTVQPTDDGKSTIQDDAEAKELWRRLIQGIRIRPGAV